MVLITMLFIGYYLVGLEVRRVSTKSLEYFLIVFGNSTVGQTYFSSVRLATLDPTRVKVILPNYTPVNLQAFCRY